jgi:twinkle protein
MQILRPLDQIDALAKVRRSGSLRGLPTGFRSLDRVISLRRGFPLFIAGAPGHGKSIFVKQIAINAAARHGWRILAYMGEEGSGVDLIGDLVEMKVRKDLRQKRDSGFDNPQAMTEDEFFEAIQWVDRHFRVICPDEVGKEPFTLERFHAIADSQEFDATILDPWNDLDHDFEKYGGREDVYLANALRDIRRRCRDSGRLDIVVNHIGKIHADRKTEDGRRYQGPAMPTEWAGGQTWFRRAFQMVLVYRPPAGFVIEAGGQPIEEGTAWIFCQKTKPKGVGALGRVVLRWDRDRHQFVEFDDDGQEFGPWAR